MEVSNESALFLTQPKEILNLIVKNLHTYDTILLRASSKQLYKLCKELHPFPKFYVLDQEHCMNYFIEKGYLSCIQYVKNTLRFDWSSFSCKTAVQNGQVDVLKFLLENNCPFEFGEFTSPFLECAQGTCNIDMIKYMQETGVSLWDKVSEHNKSLVVSNVASHGHVECLKYLMQIGDVPKKFKYTSTIDCLEFAIENGFEWTSQEIPQISPLSATITASIKARISPNKNICEFAAQKGNLTILKYAHEKKFVPLGESATMAACKGDLNCLIYAIENGKKGESIMVPSTIANIECFKYLMEKFGLERVSQNFNWYLPASEESGDYLRCAVKSGLKIDFEIARSYQLGWIPAENFKFILDNSNTTKYDPIIIEEALEEFSHENIMLLIGRNMVTFDSKLNDDAITQLYRRALFTKDVRNVKLVYERYSKAFTPEVLSNQLLSRSNSEIVSAFDFITQKGFEWTSKHLFGLVYSGNLPVLAYVTRGCPWGDEVYLSVSPLCVKYAKDHGCTNFASKMSNFIV